MKKVLFGLNIPTSTDHERHPAENAVRAEALGFDFVSANDHPCGTDPSYETWTMLAWIAAKTSRIKVATRVLGAPYRPPPIVAKMAETLNRLSGGRLILGLGGGYSDDEFRAFGLAVPSPAEKIEGLEEAVRIIRGLWSTSEFTLEGRYHRTDMASIEPKPDPHIPIWLGTFGKRALAVTGRVADGWIPTLDYAPPERIPAMRDAIFASAEAAGRDPGELTLAYNMQFRIGQVDAPYVVSGSPTEVAERLAGFIRLGFSAMNFAPAGPEPDRQVYSLAQTVLPMVESCL